MGINLEGSFSSTVPTTTWQIRAWVFINNTSGGMGTYGSGNVSSVDDLGAGAGRVNFSTAMSGTGYACVSSLRRQAEFDMLNVGFANNTGHFRFDSFTNGTGTADLPAYAFAVII